MTVREQTIADLRALRDHLQHQRDLLVVERDIMEYNYASLVASLDAQRQARAEHRTASSEVQP